MKKISDFISRHSLEIILICCTCLLILTIFKKPKIKVIENEVVRFDTIYKTIEIKDSLPKLIEEKVVGKIDTIVKIETNDTVTPVIIDIPKQQKTFSNTLVKDDFKIKYLATISGYKPELDDIDFIITKQDITKTIHKQKRFTHGINVGVGYGFINKKPDLYIGYGFQINF